MGWSAERVGDDTGRVDRTQTAGDMGVPERENDDGAIGVVCDRYGGLWADPWSGAPRRWEHDLAGELRDSGQLRTRSQLRRESQTSARYSHLPLAPYQVTRLVN